MGPARAEIFSGRKHRGNSGRQDSLYWEDARSHVPHSRHALERWANGAEQSTSGGHLGCCPELNVTGKRAGTSPVNAAVGETIMERQAHFQSSDENGPAFRGCIVCRSAHSEVPALSHGAHRLPKSCLSPVAYTLPAAAFLPVRSHHVTSALFLNKQVRVVQHDFVGFQLLGCGPPGRGTHPAIFVTVASQKT